ncbi:MAG: hypothetical protein DCC64_01870 [Planctomycetota bacterium]|nr:MAG: hypothetical protein DCC64_01870 [Planctomycetota bacterium]
MPLPSEIQAIVNAAEGAARQWLVDAKQQSAAGAAEAVALAEQWRARMTVLIRKWSGGALSLEDFGRAVESEKEALAFNLAALAQEQKRKFLAGLLGSSLDFLGRIIGAGLGALKP